MISRWCDMAAQILVIIGSGNGRLKSTWLLLMAWRLSVPSWWPKPFDASHECSTSGCIACGEINPIFYIHRLDTDTKLIEITFCCYPYLFHNLQLIFPRTAIAQLGGYVQYTVAITWLQVRRDKTKLIRRVIFQSPSKSLLWRHMSRLPKNPQEISVLLSLCGIHWWLVTSHDVIF